MCYPGVLLSGLDVCLGNHRVTTQRLQPKGLAPLRELFGDDPQKVIPLWPQLAVFHRHRVARVLEGSADEDSDAPEAWGRGFLEAARDGRVMGGNAASFLTSF